jgi:hypothetical protein
MIAAVGGIEVAAGDRLNAPPDLLLFVVLPGTTPTATSVSSMESG